MTEGHNAVESRVCEVYNAENCVNTMVFMRFSAIFLEILIVDL